MKRFYLALALAVLWGMLCPLYSGAQGATMSNPLVMNTYPAGSHTYTDSRNNAGFGNDYGQSSEDIFYRFTVQGNTTLSISTCSSGFDTYLHLLNGSGGSITYNDDSGPLCSGLQASIQATLAAGTYYIVAEGYNSSGVINLSVNLVVQAPPTPVVSDPRNFVKTWVATAPEQDANALIGKELREVKHSVTYYDGLGRPEQLVVKKGSLSALGNNDVVTPFAYDEYGREVKKYLPYVAASSDGLYRANASTDQLSFNQNWYNSQNESAFYSQTKYEASPLNRVEEQYAPGSSWAGSAENPNPALRKGVKANYWTNTPTDAVRVWSVTEVSNDFGTYASSSIYGEGQLYKHVTVDENSKQVIEFKDKEGKVILKKVQLTAANDEGTIGKDHTGWLCTYYIYDDLGQLRAVLQPKAVELLNGNGWVLSTDILNELCFRYEYDARGRMIQKKVPGAGVVQMVYDSRDRLVLSQDANMRKAGQEKWLVTLYDELNRPVKTGLWNNSQDGAYHRGQAMANSSSFTPYPFASEPTSGWELLTETHYDDYNGLPAGLSSSLQNYYGSSLDASAAAPDYAEPLEPSPQTLGMVTWSRVKVLGTASQFTASVNLYDQKGRVIQTQSTNVTGGIDIVTTRYDFSGKVLGSHVRHQKLGGTAQEYGVATKNSYDALGRITAVQKNVNGSGWKSIVSMEYDALGQLQTKTLSPDYNGTGLETLSYAYNIRGWLLGVNRNYLKETGTSGFEQHYFGFELGYDKQVNTAGRDFTAAQLNGNINGLVWKSEGDQVRRKYDFGYDPANRLLRALFEQNDGPGTWGSGTVNYKVLLGSDGHDITSAYDANGNIQRMQQWGLKGSSSTQVDDLRYSYYKGGNKLQAVSEQGGGTTEHFLGDFTDKNTTDKDYGYDPNGNLVTDLNKRIGGVAEAEVPAGGAISYNYLNLPEQITVNKDDGTLKGTITYSYDAAGNKLKKVVQEVGQPAKTTLYLLGTYENDVLQFLPQEEGRIRYKTENGSFVYDYFIKDHLGNVRMVLTEEQRVGTYTTVSFEDGRVSEEQVYFENVDVQRTVKPIQGTREKAQLLSKNMRSIGAGKLLKVMAGDRLHVKVDYYSPSGRVDNREANGLKSVLSNLVSVLEGGATQMVSKGQGSALVQSLEQAGALGEFFRPQHAQAPSTRPKAYLNILFFDEQLRFVEKGSEAVPVKDMGSWQQLARLGGGCKKSTPKWLCLCVCKQ